MIPLSDRHALPVIVVILLLALPVGYHALFQPRIDDCAHPSRLRELDSLPHSTRAEVVGGRKPLGGVEWIQGALRIDRPWKLEPRWRIARSYDLSGFYFTPPGFFSNFFPEHTAGTLERSAGGVDLPIHVVLDDSEGFRNFAAYLYIFAGRPVRHPVPASLRHAIQQILAGALPLNMILVEGGSTIENAPENEEILIDWMGSAWLEFDRACGS